MKRINILILTICAALITAQFSFSQTLVNPNGGTVTSEVANRAISQAINANGTDSYSGSLDGSFSYTYITDKAISITIPAAQVNTGASTFNFDGLGVRDIKKWSSGVLVDVAAGDLIGTVRIRYNGTQFVLEGGGGSGGGSTPTLEDVLIVGDDAGGNTISNLADPTLAQQAATKNYVDLGRDLVHNTQSGTSYTLLLSDGRVTIVEMNNASANTLTVPLNSTVAFPVGTTITVAQYGAGLTTIAATGGVTINTSSGSMDSPGQFAPMVLEKRGTNEWYLWNGTAGGGGVGTVTSVSSANSDLTVATGTTTPVLTVVSAPILTTTRTIGTATGDVTSAGSSFNGSANNTNALTLATVNSNVGSFGSATAAGTFTVNGKGLITAASNTTITPAVGSITGLGTNVSTWLATPSWTNFNSAVTGTAPFWSLSSGGTLTGVNTITSNAMSQLIKTGAITATANNQIFEAETPAITLRSTVSDVAYNERIQPSFLQTANTQVGVALDINPSLTTNGFTGGTLLPFSITNGSTRVFDIGNTGAVTFRSSAGTALLTWSSTSGALIGSNATTQISPLNETNGWAFLSGAKNTTGSMFAFSSNGNNVTASPINAISFTHSGGGSFNPASGASDFNTINLTPTINQTGTSSGPIRGFIYNPTLTAILGANYGIVSVPANALSGYATATPNSTLHVNGSFSGGYVAKTALYTATLNDYTIECTSGTFTVTLPTAVGITGRIYNIVNSGAGTITVGTTSSQTFVNVTATPTTLTMATIGVTTVQSNGANWMKISGL